VGCINYSQVKGKQSVKTINQEASCIFSVKVILANLMDYYAYMFSFVCVSCRRNILIIIILYVMEYKFGINFLLAFVVWKVSVVK